MSVLEWILAIAISAIVLSSGVWSVAEATRSLRLKTETRRFETTLEFLHSYALHSRQQLIIHLTSSEYRGVTASETILMRRTLPEGFTLTASRSLHFLYPSGTVSPNTFHIDHSGKRCSIISSLRGRIRTECDAVAP